MALSGPRNSGKSNEVGIREAASWLRKTYGKERVMVWNLSTKTYDTKVFDDKVVQLSSPVFPLLPALSLCRSVSSWMSMDSQNIAVFQCRTGRGRSSAAAACYLHFSQRSRFSTIEKALTHVAINRSTPLRNLLNMTQIRFTHYFADFLARREKEETAAARNSDSKRDGEKPKTKDEVQGVEAPQQSEGKDEKDSEVEAPNNSEGKVLESEDEKNSEGKTSIMQKGLCLERVILNHSPDMGAGGIYPCIQVVGEKKAFYDGYEQGMPQKLKKFTSGKIEVGCVVDGPFLVRLCHAIPPDVNEKIDQKSNGSKLDASSLKQIRGTCLVRIGLDSRLMKPGVVRVGVADVDIAFSAVRRLPPKFFLDLIFSLPSQAAARASSFSKSSLQSPTATSKDAKLEENGDDDGSSAKVESDVSDIDDDESIDLKSVDELSDGEALEEEYPEPDDEMVDSLLKQIGDALGNSSEPVSK
eukprot:CAMPEP_0167756518 /NCGR_PEP_ID=MMETSP0110_2-20121227/9428_1 /TAXON_ID=629695 /ORGANISM="Gymnochlora sp., Strain CCMP2014" /LENGTH=469 /DNA_ID=CAMNT_0007642633 /DNA_START=102 /DNA_END=1511 /DNA_ORIENTATION=-